MTDLLLVGLLDQGEGHYQDFARRWLTVLDLLKDSVNVKGYVTIRSFSSRMFDGNGIPLYNVFDDVLNPQGLLALVPQRLKSRLCILGRLKLTCLVLDSVPCDTVLFLGMDPVAFSFFNVGRFRNKKLVPILHTLVPLERGNSLKRAIFKASLMRLIEQSYKVIVLEEAVQRVIVGAIEPRSREKVVVVPDPRWPKQAPGVGNQQKLMPRKFLLIGIVSPAKGFDIAVKAFRRILPEFPDVQLTIAGKACNDAYSKVLTNLLSDIGDSRVVWLNRYLDSEEYMSLIAQSDCVLLPYLSSTGSRSSGVLLDALELGKPVIMSDIPAFLDIYQKHGIGLLFRAGDADDLSVKVRKVLEEGFSVDQLKAIKRCMDSYSPQSVANKLMQVLGPD